MWLGITLLSTAVIISSFLGQYQQLTYAKYGSQWREGLFYTHILALPFFLLFWDDLSTQINEYNSSPKVYISDFPPFKFFQNSLLGRFSQSKGVGIGIPILWLYLLFNTLTQYMCISGVYKLSSLSTAVTLNLILSIRKFVSLLLSIY
ncbi:golgi uridine diphosphate-N- acetylglucosamine transporter, partial [Quaeritorhiza haematococci]